MEYILAKHQIIGFGEATHGQERITKFRIKIFKNLVKNHGFTSFVLEDSYAVCTIINRYIQNKLNIDINKIQLMTPFCTKFMYNLIKWMKNYNKRNGNILEFIGIDLQYYNEDVITKMDEYAYKLFNNNRIERDEKMFKLFVKMFNPRNKYFIYAHMGHLQIKDKVLGYYLKNHFRKSYYSIGNVFYNGEYSGLSERGKIYNIEN